MSRERVTRFFDVSQERITHFFDMWRERITRFLSREMDLRTSSGKFLRVKSRHAESFRFLGLWMTPHITSSGGTDGSDQQEGAVSSLPLPPVEGSKDQEEKSRQVQIGKTTNKDCIT